MKINKLMELWKETAESMGEEDIDPEELLNVLQFFDRSVRQAGYHFTPYEPSRKTGKLRLQVTVEEGNAPAEVKLWASADRRIHHRFSLRRRVTDARGVLECELPVGHYWVQIAKGLEYEKKELELEVEEGTGEELPVRLRRIAHFTDRGWYAGDLHHHSIYSSPAYGGTDPVIETALQVKQSMQALGLNFGALSDHHNICNHEEWRALETADFLPLVSKEISTSNGHVLSLGVEKDVIYQVPRGAERTREALLREFLRITDEIRRQGGLPQVNHPFDASASTRYNQELLPQIGMFESIEIWNGATPFLEHSINGKAFFFWLSCLERGMRLTATAGSDTHNCYGDDYFGMIEWLDWLVSCLKAESAGNPAKTGIGGIPASMQKKASWLLSLYETMLPVLTEWVAESNTPSTIHNYVLPKQGQATELELLQAIREGRLWISNGPLLQMTLENAGLGETAKLKNGRGILRGTIISPIPLEHLTIYTGAERKRELALIKGQEIGAFGEYHYEGAWELELADAAFVVGMAGHAPNCLVITNPIYIKVPDGRHVRFL